RGQLVPDELTVKIWRQSLMGHIAISRYKPPDEFLVLDGIPRNPHQVVMMNAIVNVLHVIHLVCSDVDEMVDRIKRRAIRENRADDANEDVIRTRFDVYRRESEPVINAYPTEVISQVDAMLSPPEVLVNILQKLVPVRNAWLKSLPNEPF
ncbi:MAG: nucleoside monophosphate kinase, partial [Planctomycetes bacterium]|nr:nucleoside monophosphate kinase [Planctomycetota bacterium]